MLCGLLPHTRPAQPASPHPCHIYIPPSTHPSTLHQDVSEYIEGMHEYDVPYHVRFAIDTGEVACNRERGDSPLAGSRHTWLIVLCRGGGVQQVQLT